MQMKTAPVRFIHVLMDGGTIVAMVVVDFAITQMLYTS